MDSDTVICSFKYETPNFDTIAAIKEVMEIKKNPGLYKAYDSFEELLGDLDS